jgi:hypothetical protein
MMSMKDLRSKLTAIACRRSGVIKRRHVAVDDQIAVDGDWCQLADRLRYLVLDVVEQRLGDTIGKRHVEFAGDEGQC